MAFRLVDVKKTVRRRSDGERQLYPKMLDGQSTTQIELALSYLNSRLGRRRCDVDPETLIRFFGDAKVARGMVSCLSGTYRWRTQQFADVLDSGALARLEARGLSTPSDLRLHLFDAVNRHGAGFLAPEREENLLPLARRLRLTPNKLDQLVALDAPENAVLVRIGDVPAAEAVVAEYNFRVVDAIMRASASVAFEGVRPHERNDLAEACRAQSIPLSWSGADALLSNVQDSYGSFTRAGGRLARAIYMALAASPSLLRSGYARVKVPGGCALYPIKPGALDFLTGDTDKIWRSVQWPELRAQWDRYRAANGVGDWRLVANPEPHLSTAGLVLARYACRREDCEVVLWPVSTADELEAARAVDGSELNVLVVADDAIDAYQLRSLPHVRASEGVAGLVRELCSRWPHSRVDSHRQALATLVDDAALRGFVPVEEVATSLGCTSLRDVEAIFRNLDESRAIYVAGMGLCSPQFVAGMRKGLRRARRRDPAA